jgi:hypothetical protein
MAIRFLVPFVAVFLLYRGPLVDAKGYRNGYKGRPVPAGEISFNHVPAPRYDNAFFPKYWSWCAGGIIRRNLGALLRFFHPLYWSLKTVLRDCQWW